MLWPHSRTHQILPLQAVFYLPGEHSFRGVFKGVYSCFFVLLVGGNRHNHFIRCLGHFGLVEQETQLFHD